MEHCSLTLISVSDVQDRWETEKQGVSLWSRRWDTTLRILKFQPAALNRVGGHCQAAV